MNDKQHIYYVYEHWRPDTNSCFYVGKGKGRRAWTMRGRNIHHKAIVSRLTSLGIAVDVRLIITDLTQETAFRVEMERVALYDRKKLANKTDGGDGVRNLSEDGRAKISSALKGNKHSIGVKRTYNQRAELSRRMTGNTIWLGRKLTKEHKSNLSKAHKGKHYWNNRLKAVMCVDDGLVFASISAAAKHYGIQESSISQVCTGMNKHRKTAGGRRFKHIEAA